MCKILGKKSCFLGLHWNECIFFLLPTSSSQSPIDLLSNIFFPSDLYFQSSICNCSLPFISKADWYRRWPDSSTGAAPFGNRQWKFSPQPTDAKNRTRVSANRCKYCLLLRFSMDRNNISSLVTYSHNNG